MANDLVLIEQQLQPLMPSFAQVLPPEIPPSRLVRSLLVACEMQPYLMQCDRNSLLRTVMTAAVLGLDIDGVTGLAYAVPFGGKVQLIVGYKGFAAIAARSGRTLEGFVVREGDDFTFDEANGIVHHKKRLGGEKQRHIIAAYATSRGNGLPTMVRVLSMDEIMSIRDRSAGYKARPNASPWSTDFDAMARKCPIRMLAKDIPNISLQAAAALETHHDLGHEAYIRQDRAVIVDGVVEPLPPSVGPSDLTKPLPPPTKPAPAAAKSLPPGITIRVARPGPVADGLVRALHDSALAGADTLKDAWTSLTKTEQNIVGAEGLSDLKKLAAGAQGGGGA